MHATHVHLTHLIFSIITAIKFGEQYHTNYEAPLYVCIIPYKFLSLLGATAATTTPQIKGIMTYWTSH